MVTQCDINKELFRAKQCSASLSLKYVNAVRYGYKDKANEFFGKLVFLKGVIRIFSDYTIICNNNYLPLISNSQRANLSEEEINCVSEEELCALSKKVQSICSTC